MNINAELLHTEHSHWSLYFKTRLSLKLHLFNVMGLKASAQVLHVVPYSLTLHPHEDHIEHLCEGGLGRGLVHKVLAGQVDVVACAHCV